MATTTNPHVELAQYRDAYDVLTRTLDAHMEWLEHAAERHEDATGSREVEHIHHALTTALAQARAYVEA